MPTGKYELDGKLLPGTTTIIGKFKNSGALIHWAWKQGMDGIDSVSYTHLTLPTIYSV